MRLGPHFVNEFKRYFGVTPRSYADSQRNVVPLRMTWRPAGGRASQRAASGTSPSS